MPRELSCPCWRITPVRRGAPARPRLALFLLSQQLEISGAVIEGRWLDSMEALQLWTAWEWQPSAPEQSWPRDLPEVPRIPPAPDW